MQKFMCYCTGFALIYFEFEGTSQALAPKGLHLAVTITCEEISQFVTKTKHRSSSQVHLLQSRIVMEFS